VIAHVLLTLGLVELALLLGACAYESVVMAPNYERDVPASIDTARQFLSRRTPAHYFRVISPLTQLVLLAGVIASWAVPSVRFPALVAFGALVLTEGITFAYQYPRLGLMFKASTPQDPARLRRAAREWAIGNIVRIVLLLLSFFATLRGIVAGADQLHH
jgi:hypothetical protein